MRPLPAIVRTEEEAKILKSHVFMKARSVIISPGAYTILEGCFRLAPKERPKKGPAGFNITRVAPRITLVNYAPEDPDRNTSPLPPALRAALTWLLGGKRCSWDYKTMDISFGFLPVAQKLQMNFSTNGKKKWLTDFNPSASVLKLIHRRIWLMGLMGNYMIRGGSLTRLPVSFFPSWVPRAHRAGLKRIMQLTLVSQMGEIL